MTKLNPCPKCGSEPDIFEYGERHSHIYCTECGDPTEVMSLSASGAINAWNAATGEQPAKTLRDEFAMAAHVDGEIIDKEIMRNSMEFNSTNYAKVSARIRYLMADLMLKERSK